MPIAPFFALCTAVILCYVSSVFEPKLGELQVPGLMGSLFIIPFLTWTVRLAPLVIFELVWRRSKTGKFEIYGNAYLLMVVYFAAGQIFGKCFSELMHGYRPPALVDLHFHGIFGYVGMSILTLLTIDLLYYWIHRAQHANTFLWKFHSKHHAIQDINSYNCFHHISEHVVDFVIGVFVSMFVFGFDGVPPFIAVYMGIVGQYNHARIDFFDFGKARLIFGDPKFHLSHHLNDKRFIGKNFGGFTAIYDVIFRTYQEPDQTAFTGPYGVDGMSNPSLLDIVKI